MSLIDDIKPSCPTARQIIESRLGRDLPPTRDLPPDLREAIKRLAIERARHPATTIGE